MADLDETDPGDGGSTRRAFIQGVAGAIAGAAIVSGCDAPQGGSESGGGAAAGVGGTSASADAANYPPMLQGLRGQNDPPRDVVHALRDGAAMPPATDTGEEYDLVVVGSGMSGLGAAYFFKKALRNAKVLVLEACDDFGGHARRNEFQVDGKQVIAAGGTYFIQVPDSYTPEGKALLADIGFDRKRYMEAMGRNYEQLARYKLTNTVFFRSETYGEDRLVNPAHDFSGASLAFKPDISWEEYLSRTPLSKEARADILKIVNNRKDHFPGLSQKEKIERLRHISYADYLTKMIGIGPEAMGFIQDQAGASSGNVGMGPDSFSAWRAHSHHYPGFGGMGLPHVPISDVVTDDQMGPDMHLPDGNGGVARLLVRWLIPAALPGNTMEDAVPKHVDYSQLDRPEHDVRIRLGSPVISAVHDGEPDPEASQSVSVTYLKDGMAHRVKAKGCVMACFNAVVPYLCPQMPAPQKEALHLAVRKPLLIATVALRNWRAFAKLNAYWITAPGCFYYATLLDPGNPLVEDFAGPPDPNKPTTVMLMHVPNFPGVSARDQFRAGRAELMGIELEEYERLAREQLGRMLAGGGFDPDRDIAGITINRWAHGYASGANDLYDPDWSHAESPWVKGRQRFGRITIANSDAAGIAMTQAAFDQANRAVKEMLDAVIQPDFSKTDPQRG